MIWNEARSKLMECRKSEAVRDKQSRIEVRVGGKGAMTQWEETRLKNLQAKKAAEKKLTELDIYYLKKLERKKRQESNYELTSQRD